MSRHLIIAVFFSAIAATSPRSEERLEVVEWKLVASQVNGTSRAATDDFGFDTWHFLRTTNHTGPVASRTWHRDGQYAPLDNLLKRMFGLPLSGAIFQTTPTAKAPFVAGVGEDYTIDCTFKRGEILVCPGPDHAAILAWKSPFDGVVSIQGAFNNRQTCCSVNSQVNWYIERGGAPNLEAGLKPTLLAQGTSNREIEDGISRFDLNDLEVSVGDYFYFIVDAKADGSGSPHHGDGTALDLTITMSCAALPPPPTFEEDVRPLLAAHCHECHGEDSQEAGLDIRTVAGMLYGGESGSALTPGKLGESYCWTMIESGEMPPEGSKPLSDKSKSLIRRWIAGGAVSKEDLSKVKPRTFVTAKDREYWAFRPPRRHKLPSIEHADLASSPLDYLLLKRLQDKALSYSPVAPKEVLIRRLYFDLTGLPPTPAQLDEFSQETSPDAYERLVDRLLASPRYGERWGRHWMDTVGYVDVRLYDGDGTTVYPNEGMWRYRDYIIRSFNSDKPYDDFIQEQLAGDEMVNWRTAREWTPEILEKLVATGYLRNIEDHTSEAQYGIDRRYEMMFDMMSMVSTSLLGLTFECSRCHNHKYDPITQRDYYSLLAFFESSFNAYNWLKPQQRWIADVGPIDALDIDRHNADIDGKVTTLQSKLAELEKASTGNDTRPAEAKKANAEEVDSLKAQIAELSGSRQTYGKIQALFDVPNPPTSRVFRRGDCFKPGIPVKAGLPEVLTSIGQQERDRSDLSLPPQTSGRRLELARWVTSRQNPMTARVIMNRLWLHHFGEAIVATPGNLGRNGAPPSHPEILDWMAVEFQDNDWSLKHMHRLVLTSRAYKQASRRPTETSRAEQIDPDNQLLWRQNLKRLESEILRDAVLAASGRLDLHAFGKPVPVTKPVNGLSMAESGPGGNGHNRRSVYIFARRVYPLKFMELFDAPIMAVNCSRRTNSTTVLQSFAQLNSDFVVHASRDAAKRIQKSAGVEPTNVVNAGYRMIIGRRPSEDEQQACIQFLADQTAAYREEGQAEKADSLATADLCHMLLCTNEFLYVE
ncbi:MAG: PSD1 domain-containing protein [Planctomycetes bacterium]|nr:PSD1 domain-containing protein [Planctomycetota bacterium]